MVTKKTSKKANKKEEKKSKKVVEEVEEDEHAGGASLDDAFADSDDVDYGKPKPKKEKKKKIDDEEEELEEELDEIEAASPGHEINDDYQINSKKPISILKKGSKLNIDGADYEVDAHYVLIDHGTTKEMALEIFDPKTDKDYQLRYFSDQVERTLQLYELQEILYVKKGFKKISW